MSKVRADNYADRVGTGAPLFPNGVIVSAAATFTGNVSIAGTLTYEDVTNVDSIGLITARTGIQVLAGGINAIGIVTTSTGLDDQSGGLTLDSWLYSGS